MTEPYIDLISQLIICSIAGIGVTIKLYWYKIKAMIIHD